MESTTLTSVSAAAFPAPAKSYGTLPSIQPMRAQGLDQNLEDF